MADRSGPDLTSPDLHLSITEDGEMNSKKKRMNELMESLRNKKGKGQTWNDTSKVLRMSMTDKRHQIETMEKQNLSKHLGALQRSFKVSGFVAVLERLEFLCSSLSLKFTKGHQNSDLLSVFITWDVFNVEVILDSKGTVKDVKIYHSSEPVHCAELVKLLNNSDFEAFQEHLMGIMAIYNISGDKKQRMKAFTALQALETDLNNLSKLQSTINSVPNFIHKTPLGILVPRVGGTLMRMVYFVGPYDLLDRQTKSCKPMTIEGITENSLGHSVTVCIEASMKSHKLQTMPLMTVNKTHEGKSLPRFTDFNNMNCTDLNAVFALKLHKKMPLSLTTIKAIISTTGINFDEQLSIKPFWEVLIESISGVAHCDSVSVNLPDQNHSYYLGGPNGSSMDQSGGMVETIPFLHPTHVPKIIAYLRQQAIYNTVLSSCIRNSSQQDLGKFLTFEILPSSMQTINVTFEHPYTDAITTAEFDLSDITCLRCRICSSQVENKEVTKIAEICTDEFATKIFQRCLSLPVTLRSMFSEAYHKMEQHIVPLPMSPPSVKKNSGKRTLSSILPFQLFHFHSSKNPAVPMSRKGQERRAAFLEAYRDNKMLSLNSTLSSNGGSLLSSFTSTQTGAVNNTSSASIPPPAYSQHQQSSVMQSGNSKTLGSGLHSTLLVNTNSRENGGNSNRDTAVVSPEIVQAYESGLADPTQAPKEVLDAIKKDKISKNPMLASLLDQERDSPEPAPSQPSMLISLLGENNPSNPSNPTPQPPNNAVNSSNNLNPTSVPNKQTNFNYQQQTQNQIGQKKVRKRKSTGDGGTNNSNIGNHYSQFPNNNSNAAIMGRSPKRLLSEEHSLQQPFPFSSMSSAENSTSQQYHHHHLHHSNHPMGHGNQMNHPIVGMGGVLGSNSLDGLPPSLSQQQQQSANFHSQTRVGGVNPLLPIVSSSVVMVTESNLTQQIVSSSDSLSSNMLQENPLSSTNTSNSQAIATSNMLVTPAASPKFTEESPVFQLANTLDSIIKQESKSVSSAKDNLITGASSINSVSNASAKFSQYVDLLSKKESSAKTVNSSVKSIKEEKIGKGGSSKNCDVSKKCVIGRTTSIDDVFKPQMSLELECENIPNPVKEKSNTGLKGGASNSSFEFNPSKSIGQDPYEFNDNFLSGSVDDYDSSDQSEMSWDSVDKSTFNSNASNTSLSKIITSKHHSKEKYGHYEVVKIENCVIPKKEKKKSSRESKDYYGDNNTKPIITVKINAKEGSARTYVKQSPLHRSESPQELSRRLKESHIMGKQGNVTPDRASDISTDSDVFVVGSDSASFTKTGSSHVNNSISPRILTSKKVGSYRASGSSHKEKKKKSSKTSQNSDSKQEKKRKRAEEAMKKDQLKKQKVYDFDFNESEHLPPTKIKIRTSSDGKVQIQTGSGKPYSMSPLPMKVDSELKSSPSVSSGGNMKRHKSDKSLKHKKDKSEKYNRSKSEPQGAKLDKSDSKLYSRTPVVKIKPLDNASCSSISITSATSTVVNSKTSATGHIQSTPIVKITVSPLVSSSNVTTTIAKSSSTTGIKMTTSTTSGVNSKQSSDNSTKNKLSVSSESISSKSSKHNAITENSSGKISKQVNSADNTSKTSKSIVGTENSSTTKSTKQVVASENSSLKSAKTNASANSSYKTSKQIAASVSSENISAKSVKTVAAADTYSKSKVSNNENSAKTKQISSAERSKSSSNSDSFSKSKTIIINNETSSKSKQVLNSENSAKSKLVNLESTKSKPSSESSSSKSKNSSEERKRQSSSSGINHASTGDTVKNKQTVPVSVTSSSNSSDSTDSVVAKIRLPSSSDKSNSGSEKHKSKLTNHGSSGIPEKESSTQKTKHEKSEKVSSNNPQSNKTKSDKSTSGDVQKKQRKASLTAVIDKLKKGFNEAESEPKKAQEMSDVIRRAILKAGATKSSTPPPGKIGKISKQDTISVPSQNSSKPVTAIVNKSSNQNAKTASSVLDGILPKPAPIGSFRIPKSSNSTNSSAIKSDIDSTKSKENAVVNTTSSISSSGSSKINTQSTIPNHITQKGSSAANHINTARQNSRENSDKANKKSKIDDISEKLQQSRHFLDAVGSIPSKDGASSGDAPSSDKKNSSQSNSKLDNKVQQNSDNTKSGNTRPDNIPPSKGDHKNWNSHHSTNSDKARSKSPVVNNTAKPSGNKQGFNSNKTGHHNANLNNFRNNHIHSSSSQQKLQQNRPRTPVEPTANKQHHHHTVNNIVEQTKPISNRDPRAGGGQAVPDLAALPSRSVVKEISSSISAVAATSSVSINSTSVINAVVPDSSNKPAMFYNPAEALGRKHGSTDINKAVSLSSTSYTPSIKKDHIKEKKLSVPLPSSKPPIIIPLDNTSATESPASPVDKPGLTIRHDTPPASPTMGGVDVSDNKENMAKSIPLDDSKIFKAPTPKSALRTDDGIKSSKIGATCSVSGISEKAVDKSGDMIIHSKPISSPAGEIHSPEDSSVIDSPIAPSAPTGKAPVTIPLERSRSRSPADRSRSPLTPRSPVQGHVSRSKTSPERSRSPLTPRSPAPIQTPSPKDASVKSPINKFNKPGSPCKAVKSPLAQLTSPGTRPSSCNSIEDDDLMNEALIL